MISASLVKELREKSGAGMLDCKKALEATNGNLDEATDWLREKGISTAAKKASRIAAEGLADIIVKDNVAVMVEVNSETDFVAQNAEFKDLITTVLNTLIANDVNTMEEALNSKTSDGMTINDLFVAKTAKIGEKLSFRRFARITKNDQQNFGAYLHMGGKIAVLTVVDGANEETAKDVAMQSAAMRPVHVRISDVTAEEVDKEKSILREQALNEGKPANIVDKMIEGRIQKFYKEVCLEEQPFIKDGDINVATYVKNNGGKIVSMMRYEVGEGLEKREENFAEEVAKQINNK